jgi:N-acetylglutamate synthase-like GNAT family acetyltransferase
MPDDPALRPASGSDWPQICALLRRAGLPTDDLEESLLHEFVVAYPTGSGLSGVIGLQRFGTTALLRSLAVAEDIRGQGLGVRLLHALEGRARASGIAEMWLLTVDADGFFARHGYVAAERATVPAAIASCAEFSSLCPASAHLMRKCLTDAG